MTTQLVRYEAACKALAEARSVDEVKDIRDKSEAMRAYGRQAKNKQLEVDAAEIRFRAERRLGELIKAQKETVGLNKGAKSGRLPKNGGARKEPPLKDDRPTLAEAGIDKKLSSRAQRYAAIPEDEFEKEISEWKEKVTKENARVSAKLGNIGEKALRKKAKAAAQSEVPDDLPPISERFKLIHSDIRKADIQPGSVDCIVTDPPYPKEYLETFSWLSEKAGEWLKPGGSMLVMSGQTWLPEVIERLASCEQISYQWAIAYLTPGGQSVQIWPRRVNTFWKPVFWFVKGEYQGDWMGDVVKSDANDKRFHHWGQSESGMAGLIERVSLPGDTVLDPFCGGGTTGAVALAMNRLFIGVDSDADAITKTKNRLAEIDDAKLVT